MQSSSISIKRLEKVYGASGRREKPVHALKPLTLDIHPGEVFGLLGPNGAGKTTLVKLMLGIVHPTKGEGSIFGEKIGTTNSKKNSGYLPENHRYPNYLTGEKVLGYFGKLSGLDSVSLRQRTASLLEMVDMTKWRHTRIKKYSKGMMQRIGLAQALINDPRVVFLDEPTDGVDPVGRKEIRTIIQRLKNEGKTIFLNSHLLSEVELISDRVAIMNKGELIRIGTVPELTSAGKLFKVEAWVEQTQQFQNFIARFAPKQTEGNSAVLETKDLHDLNSYLDAIRSEGVLIASVTPVRQTLEELFIDLIEGVKE